MLVVWKLDRLGRNLAHLVNTVQDLSTRGVGLRVLAGQGAQIDTTTAAGRLVFGIFAALAEFERELIRERTLAGLKAARARGRRRQEFALSKAQVRLAQAAMAHRDTSVSELCRGARYQAGDALQVRRAAGSVARAGREGPRHLNRSTATSTPAEHVLDLSVGFAPSRKQPGIARQHAAVARGGAPPSRRARHDASCQPAPAPRAGRETPAARRGSRPARRRDRGAAFCAGLRRSEIAALVWDDITQTGRAGSVACPRAGLEGQRLGPPRGPAPARRSPSPAPSTRCARRRSPPRPTASSRSARHQVNCRVQVLADVIGLEGVSSHSGRRGLASELVRRGASTTAVQLAGGWRSASMVARYASAGAVEDGAVARLFGPS